MNKSVDKLPPSRAELDALVARRMAHPKVQAQELAAELGVSTGTLSKFENGRPGGRLPGGVADYEAALARLKRAKRGAAA